MTLACPTLWNDSNPAIAWNSTYVRGVLDLARPPLLQLHGGVDWMTQHATALTVSVRAAYPLTTPWWAISGDAYGPDPTSHWVACARACQAAQVPVFVLDIEGAWRTRPAGVLRAAINAVQDAAPRLILHVTTAGQPLYIPNVYPPPGETGTSDQYAQMLRESMGLGSPVKACQRQVYYAHDTIPTTRGTGPRSLARSTANYAVAVTDLTVAPDVTLPVYQQMHGCRTDDLVWVATQSDLAAWWALNSTTGYSDPDGVKALRAVCELHRRGYDSRVAVYDFQKESGLVADNICGPRTLAALGIT